jgi:tetrahydromethanopterin S-methyltransferase subunit G
MSAPTKIEKQNLEAHVELCAERYNNLESKLDNLEERMDKLEGHMVDIKNSLVSGERIRTGQMIKYGITIIGVLTAAVIAFLSKGIIPL